ncbi:hypothetical protein, partial [Pseudomonas sp.]|uniref:hypothetical protein n=1 Tax=Pseudomonas sp. TaxID=306 RepID=UPI00405433D3
AHYIDTESGRHWITVSTGEWKEQMRHIHGFGEPTEPPEGPSIYVSSISPFGAWVAVFRNGEYWAWTALATAEPAP